MKKIILLLLVVLTVSCSDSDSDKNQTSSVNSSTVKSQNIEVDSLTGVDIFYYPSFTNSSILRLNRITGEGVFIVDTTIRFNYGKPDTIKFSLSDMESKTDIESFWKSSFIHSIRQDTSMLGWTDGMPVYIVFTNNNKKDSVYLGNVYPKAVDSLLMRQLHYLEMTSSNRAMKAYIKQVKEYL